MAGGGFLPRRWRGAQPLGCFTGSPVCRARWWDPRLCGVEDTGVCELLRP